MTGDFKVPKGDVWDRLMDADNLIKHEFDLRYSRVVEELKEERKGKGTRHAGLVPDDERLEIAEAIWTELNGPPALPEYEDILRAQEVYEKLERQE